ncbi:MAG: hypothetical protein EXS05_19660 [Planctomycetaceae bacterium]|nr:hypothetical protein [Planctomycetaceae bacterium]
MSNLAPAVIVYEKRPRWEAELKRHLAADRLVVRPCRSGADLLELCRAMPGSVAVIDLAVGAEAALHCLEQALLRRLGSLPLVISPSSARDLEWPLRELGALAVLPDTARGESVARLCRMMLNAARSVVAIASRR